MTGGPVRLGSVDPWMSRQALYWYVKSSPPTLITAIQAYAAVNVWETYALLLYGKRPVDFLYFPYGTHYLEKPAERLLSLNANLDWFRFWLQNVEDKDPEKADQYKRWHRLQLQKPSVVGYAL